MKLTPYQMCIVHGLTHKNDFTNLLMPEKDALELATLGASLALASTYRNDEGVIWYLIAGAYDPENLRGDYRRALAEGRMRPSPTRHVLTKWDGDSYLIKDGVIGTDSVRCKMESLTRGTAGEGRWIAQAREDTIPAILIDNAIELATRGAFR